MKLILIAAFLLATAYCSPVIISTGETAPVLGTAEQASKPEGSKLCVRKADIARIGRPHRPQHHRPQQQYKPDYYNPASFGINIPGLYHYESTFYEGKPLVADLSDKWNNAVHYFSSFPFGKYDRICIDKEDAQ